jgi:hypothetical protein
MVRREIYIPFLFTVTDYQVPQLIQVITDIGDLVRFLSVIAIAFGDQAPQERFEPFDALSLVNYMTLDI